MMQAADTLRNAPNIFDHPWIIRLLERIALPLLKWRGWTHHVDAPSEKKYVLIVAPHTSNWDFLLMFPVGLLLKRRVRFMIKHSVFVGPVGSVLRWLGGIAVERSSRHNFVQQMVDEFAQAEEMVLIITPEGTRSPVPEWKRGFYHIAHEAGVPIVRCFLDTGRRRAGIWAPFYPTGQVEADLKKLRADYDQVIPRYPEKFIRSDALENR
ncbi:MAG: glycerol acyltransferase [Spongiibacteraceae bacterium]|jgi:1-acyl-sn-glycerol-3-phosphate acyltransferase|nr:glycerol acyltransferase [Spongiibacteraceae bacterium]